MPDRLLAAAHRLEQQAQVAVGVGEVRVAEDRLAVGVHRLFAAPERHRQVAEWLAGEPLPDAGADTLPDVLRQLMRDIGAPRGIAELGYDENDVPALVEGARKQERLLVGSPREVTDDDLGHILNASMTNW